MNGHLVERMDLAFESGIRSLTPASGTNSCSSAEPITEKLPVRGARTETYCLAAEPDGRKVSIMNACRQSGITLIAASRSLAMIHNVMICTRKEIGENGRMREKYGVEVACVKGVE